MGTLGESLELHGLIVDGDLSRDCAGNEGVLKDGTLWVKDALEVGPVEEFHLNLIGYYLY